MLHSEYQKHIWPSVLREHSWGIELLERSSTLTLSNILNPSFLMSVLSVSLGPIHWFWPILCSSVLEKMMFLWYLRAGPCSASSLCNLNRPQQAKESTSNAYLKRSDITSLLIWPNTSSLVLDFLNISWSFIYQLFRRKRNQKFMSC